jgi:phosphohistidine phosphatase SixA
MSHASELVRRWLLLLPALMVAGALQGQSLSGSALLSGLRQGGYVLVMRHASSPGARPEPAQANPDNVAHERQLDDAGRSSARAMGDALRHLQIPIGHVLSSPTYRALETVHLAQLGRPKVYAQLGDSGQSMQADSSGARGAWLRAKAAQVPLRGTNTLIVTHFPNMTEAFGPGAAGLADGETLIFRPDGRGGAPLVGRVKIDEWTSLPTAH